jgi:hypothetical protein
MGFYRQYGAFLLALRGLSLERFVRFTHEQALWAKRC